MSLAPGIYLIRNRKTGYYIVPDDGTSSGDKVKTKKIGDEVPDDAKISVAVDTSGLYSFKSGSGLSIADSGKKDKDGNRYLIWKEGDSKWGVSAASAGLWNIKLPLDAKYAADNFDGIGPHVVLLDSGSPSETRWEFVNSG